MVLNLATDLVRVTMFWKDLASTWVTEEAQTTFHLRYHQGDAIPPAAFDWQTEMDHLPEQLWTKFTTHWSAAFGGFMSNSGALVKVRADHLRTDGHVLNRGEFAGVSPLVGTAGASQFPPEVAVAVSWWSYNPGHLTTFRGRKRGRMYIPYLEPSLATAQGRVRLDSLAAWTDAQQALWNDIQGMHTYESSIVAEDYWDFVTYSGKDATWHNVDYVSMDDKFDSQRRRQHQAPATREVRTITHA